MSAFMISLGVCSGLTTLIALFYTGVSKALKTVWRPGVRYGLWIALTISFLTPVKPHVGAVYTVDPGMDATVVDNTIRLVPRFERVYAVLFILWLAGGACMLLFYAYKQRRFYGYARRFSAEAPCHFTLLLKETAAGMGVENASLRLLPGLPGPIMTGVFRPTLYLPDTAYAAAELRLIFKHELTHFRHHDVFWKGLFLLARAAHWFNPFMLLFAKRFEEACELACDAAAMRGETKENKKRYCAAILNAVKAKNTSVPSPALAGAFGSGKLDLMHRLTLILSPAGGKRLRALSAVIVALILCSGAVITVTASPARQIAFDPTAAVTESFPKGDEVTAYFNEGAFGEEVTSTVVFFPAPPEENLKETTTAVFAEPAAGDDEGYDERWEPTTMFASAVSPEISAPETFPAPTNSTTAIYREVSSPAG